MVGHIYSCYLKDHVLISKSIYVFYVQELGCVVHKVPRLIQCIVPSEY
jgi:hypothetical protein